MSAFQYRTDQCVCNSGVTCLACRQWAKKHMQRVTEPQSHITLQRALIAAEQSCIIHNDKQHRWRVKMLKTQLANLSTYGCIL